MKKLGYALLASTLLVAPTAQAIEPASEPAMMLYYSMPFGGGVKRKEATPFYGFRMQMTSTESNNLIDLEKTADNNAMMDLRYTDDGMQGFYINGVNTLVETSVINAATGETETITTLDMGLVAIGILGAIAWASNDDDDCDARRRFTSYGPVLRAFDPCEVDD